MSESIVTPTKKCIKCGREFPATTEFFYARCPNRTIGTCKECKRVVMKDWETRNRERRNQTRRDWLAKNNKPPSFDPNRLKTCSRCGVQKPATNDFFIGGYWGGDGIRPECRECKTKRMIVYCDQNKEHFKEYRERNKDRRRLNCLKWRTARSTSVRESDRVRSALARLDAFKHYSAGDIKCACCGERVYEFLTLDHINGRDNGDKKSGNRLYRWLKGHGFPSGFQVLCFNCNLAKGIFGKCPHQAAREASQA